jgi:hypothetical protein
MAAEPGLARRSGTPFKEALVLALRSIAKF